MVRHRPLALLGASVIASMLVGCATGPAGTQVGPKAVSTMEDAMRNERFALSSGAFAEGAAIPRQYTCDGADASPPLSWVGAPDGTVAFALIVDDPDAGGFVHWVAYNVGASASGGLAAGVSESPDGPAQGRNSFGRVGYGGPCPPSGTHHYAFRLLALDGELPLTGTPSAGEVFATAEGHVLGEAWLTGTYRRGG